MPKLDIHQLIERFRAAHPKGVGRGLPSPNVARIEKDLGAKLPASYRAFLVKAGWIDAAGLTVRGLGSPKDKHLDVVRVTKSERAFEFPMPRELVPIADDGRGGYWCLDTARFKGGECPVVYRDHELIWDSKYRDERDSASFAAFLKREVDEAVPPPRPAADLTKSIVTFQKTARKLCGFLDDQHPAGRAKEADFAKAEKAIGRPLPASVRTLLATLDGASLGSDRMISVRADARDNHALINRVRRLERKLGKVPAAKWLPVAVLPANDWIYCIDLATPDEQVFCLGSTCEDISDKPLPLHRWFARGAKRGCF